MTGGFFKWLTATLVFVFIIYRWVSYGKSPKVSGPNSVVSDVTYASPLQMDRAPASLATVMAEADRLPPECAEGVIEISKTLDKLTGGRTNTIRESTFHEVLNTKVVRDFIAESPCKSLPPKWTWLEMGPMGGAWNFCKLAQANADNHETSETSVEGLMESMNVGSCLSLLSRARAAATYLQFGNLDVEKINSPEDIQMILSVEANFSSAPNLDRAEALTERWLKLAPKSSEARFEWASIAHARAVAMLTAENLEIYEQRMKDYIASGAVSEYSEQTARLELALLKSDWIGLKMWTGLLPAGDERKSFYLALELARTGHEGGAIRVLETESGQSPINAALVKMLKSGRWDVLTSQPIPVPEPTLTMIESSRPVGIPISQHKWFSTPPLKLPFLDYPPND